MPQIDPFRMLGRFDYATGYLMSKYNLSMRGEAPDWPTMFTALSTKVDAYDSEFCVMMAAASALYTYQIQSTTLTQEQADHQRSLGEQEAQFIFAKEPNNYANKILEERDFFIEIEHEAKRRRKETLRNVYIVVALLALIIGGIIVYNLPYFAEQREYEKIVETYESADPILLEKAVEEYAAKYPRGKHFHEVIYMPVKIVRNQEDVVRTIEAVDKYLQVDPKGPYVKECKAIADSIWDQEIEKYKSLAYTYASQKGVDFVIAMLNYMKTNNIRTVVVEANPILQLKEYSEYPFEKRSFMESFTPDPIPGMKRGTEPRLPNDLVTIKDKITLEDAQEWGIYIVSALQAGFNKVLTPNFIEFIDSNETAQLNKDKCPRVTIGYTIRTQEDSYGFPRIWTYTQSDGTTVNSASLHLGISISFDANFSLPGRNLSYTVKSNGQPELENINVDKYAVYSEMCQLSTLNFTKQLSKDFGL